MARKPGAWITRRGRKWRVIVRRPGGGTTSRTYESEATARRVREEYIRQLELGDLTVEDAIEEYRESLVKKGNKPSSITTTMHRLKPLEDVVLVARLKRRAIEPLLAGSVDTRKNTLGQWRTFFRWCVKRGYMTRDPGEGVEVEGRRRRGKEQLTIDESRRLSRHLDFQVGDETALGVHLALLLGPRASEVVNLRVRHIDDDGRLLRVPGTKSDAARRTVVLPDVLATSLLRAVSGRDRRSFVLGGDRGRTRHWLYYHTRRHCRLAGVPVVCPQGLRGTHATLATEAGVTGPLVAAALGHESPVVTERHYIADGTTEQAQRQRALRVLEGGRR